MTTVLEEPATQAQVPPAQRLRTTMAGVRLSVTSLGVRKTLTPQQKAQAADTFGAEGTYMSAAKKLLDTAHPAFKRVTGVKNQAVQLWRGMTLPYPEAGLRLIRQDDIQGFNAQMSTLKSDLDEAVEQLNAHYAELVDAARDRLGTLFNAADYPDSLVGMFDIAWDFPSVEPPSYLQQLSPDLYQQECRRVQARFDEAVRLAEEAFTAELAKLVSHLTERLSGSEDGQPKVFRNSAVENLDEFFERFRHLSIGSHEQLDALVNQAQQVVQGVQPQQLRDNDHLRQHVATELSAVQATLDGLLVDRPRRNILRTQVSHTMDLVIENDGTVRCLYDEVLDLSTLGDLQVQRGSHVEPDDDGQWYADLSPVDGPFLGPLSKRSEALSAEVNWLTENWLQV